MSIVSVKYLTGYRDALDSLYGEFVLGHASFWSEEQFEENKWLLDRLRFRYEAVAQLVKDAERTQSKLDRDRGRR